MPIKLAEKVLGARAVRRKPRPHAKEKAKFEPSEGRQVTQMKNRRLNVLFIAIIALASAPQALLDAHRLANAAQERFETEFWNVFLSYQMPGANSAEAGASRLVPAGNQRGGACPLERIPAQPVALARNSRSNEIQLRANAEARRTRQSTSATQKSEASSDESATATDVDTVPAIELSAKELKVLKAASLHSRDTGKIGDDAPGATLASFVQGSRDLRIKMREAMEMDKLLRQRTRSLREQDEELDEIPAPNPVGSM
jgi:hypothetical protein